MKIFISHASKDKKYGENLLQLMIKIGVNAKNVIFTSNPGHGIPLGQNIFRWLKEQIEEEPFVIYLLSPNYYKSIACLNEMGAAWIIENDHVAVFTPDFDLESSEFSSGALDPREMGFYLNNKDKVIEFIQLLSKKYNFELNLIRINQYIDEYFSELKIIEESRSYASEKIVVLENEKKNPEVDVKIESKKRVIRERRKNQDSDKMGEFFDSIIKGKISVEERILLKYMIDRGNGKLKTGWQSGEEENQIRQWEEVNGIKHMLSRSYPNIVQKFEFRQLIEVSELTSHGNPKEYKIKEEFANLILDVPDEIYDILNSTLDENQVDSDEFELPY